MGWETRNGRGRYYTESYRDGGQVKRRYLGSGPVAEALAAVDEEMRQMDQARRERGKAELLALAAQDAPLDDWHQAVMETVAEALRGAGFHQHHQGHWRRKRDNKED